MKRSRRVLAALATLGLLASISGLTATGAFAGKGGVKDVSPKADTPDYRKGEKLPIEKMDNLNGNPPLGPSKVGQSKIWLGLDDFRGIYTLKTYTLRGIGNHAEVWVANNLNFPNTHMLNPLTQDPTDFFSYDDCRNDGVRNVVTDDQVNYLIGQFDGNMYPTEAAWWGTPPNRNGNKSTLPKQLPNIKGLGVNVPQSYYSGEGDNIVVLVDNVRDDNFYDENNVHTNSYIAGFYSSTFDDYFDRTVMSIDAFDWLHRTGANPPHNPTADPCTSAPARPFLYEGTFAHEYQHLLHRYTDPDEVNWVNEGLSDFTEVITGYSDISKHVNEEGYDSHTNCYLGWDSVGEPNWNPIPRPCGPENGLTAWGDQGDGEILADYGFAMYFMNYVNSQGFGQSFFHAWQHNPGNGIDGLNATLAAAGSSKTYESLFDDEIISALADGYLDAGASGAGAQFQNSAANATIYFSGNANDTTGAPPWGADYIDLGSGGALTGVAFAGDDQFFYPGGTQWVVDGDGYYTNPDATGNTYADDLDLSMARSVAGHDGQVLSFDQYYAMELGWDFGFVQVSTDNGATWTSLACTGTTTAHNPDAMPWIVAELPGFTGPSDNTSVTTTVGTAGAPVHVTCPALPAGSDLIAFRLMTDPAAEFDGWHVKNIQLGGVDLGTPGSLTGWDNQQFFNPTDLTFGFALVGLNGTVDAYGKVTSATSVKVFRPTLVSNEYTLTAGDLSALAGYGKVVAVIWGIPAAENSTLYQPYSLIVNGAERADGA